MKYWTKLLLNTNEQAPKRLALSCIFALIITGCSSNDESDSEGTTADTTTGSTSGTTTGTTAGTTTENTTGTSDGATSGNDPTAGIGTDSTAGTTPAELGPLPNPALSEAPSANDEPTLLDSIFHTASPLQLVGNPGARIPEAVEVELTDADFEAGPLPAVISVPDNIDPATNAPPMFENLNDVETVAGELLEVLYKPVDADGDLPGMFPEELPAGGSFDDNFDGTKTFRWQPLQMDVGINEFTVTALDNRNNQYRTTRTIRIKVTLPEDPSNIPNVAPTLEPFVDHTVRLNDPVVLELKGIDLNGTIATLELLTDLPGASFVQHPRFEEIYTLQFIPTSVGLLEIDVLARDSIDSSLTSVGTVSVNVLAESEFTGNGQRLRELAASRNIKFGFAALPFFYNRPDGAIYAAIAAAEFDLVSPESTMKMAIVNPFPGRYEFADVDNLITFAKQHNIEVHGHPLVWHRQVPDWILDAEPESLNGHMREYIVRLMSRYKDDINLWDVVNEPIGDNGGFRESVWYQGMGESYLDIAYRQAREMDPDAILVLNDFDIAIDGPKADTLFTMIDSLQEQQTPLDAIGFQMHLFTSFDQFDEVRANFQKVADRDLDIYITELDVSLNGEDSFETQAQVYKTIVEICLDQPRCKAIQTWGFTDQYSFREVFLPLLFDKDYQTKPAYDAIQSTLENYSR